MNSSRKLEPAVYNAFHLVLYHPFDYENEPVNMGTLGTTLCFRRCWRSDSLNSLNFLSAEKAPTSSSRSTAFLGPHHGMNRLPSYTDYMIALSRSSETDLKSMVNTAVIANSLPVKIKIAKEAKKTATIYYTCFKSSRRRNQIRWTTLGSPCLLAFRRACSKLRLARILHHLNL